MKILSPPPLLYYMGYKVGLFEEKEKTKQM